jgi:hypothetical protein
MSEHESEFLKEIKKTIANYLIGAVFLIATSGMVFYFSTSYRLQTLESQSRVLDETKAEKAVMDSELKAVNNTLIRIENKVDKINK